MSMISFGDLTQSFLLKSQTARLKSEVGRVSQELASGRLSDIGAAVAGDYTQLAALTRSRTIAEGFQSAAQQAAAQASATQPALEQISNGLDLMVSPLYTASQQDSAAQFGLAASDARARIDAALSTLNTSVAGRSLFAGVNLKDPAVAASGTMISAVRTAVAGATNATDLMNRISDWFSSPTGFAAVGYLGGPATSEIMLSPTERISASVTADDPALRSALTGLFAAAMLDDASLGLPTPARRELARLAGDAMLAGQVEVTALAARLGQTESRIDAVLSASSADILTHELATAELVQSDPYRLATELEAVRTNLETVYAVTARLSRLSLVDFLR